MEEERANEEVFRLQAQQTAESFVDALLQKAHALAEELKRDLELEWNIK